jgi:hypothetical protein
MILMVARLDFGILDQWQPEWLTRLRALPRARSHAGYGALASSLFCLSFRTVELLVL